MPTQVVFVHDDEPFRAAAIGALRGEGYTVTAFCDALEAMIALETLEKMELLVTRAAFPEGRSNGAALALMVKSRKSGARVIFTDDPALEGLVSDLGRFLPMPVIIPDLLDAVRNELGNGAPRQDAAAPPWHVAGR